MKIITKDNFSRDAFTEKVIAENVNEYIGEQMVNEWNTKHWSEISDYYLDLVADDYVPYDGFKEMYGDL